MSNKSASKVTRTRDRSEATTLAPVSVFMHLTDRQGKPARGKKFSCHEPVFNQHTRKGEPNRRQSRKKALFKPYKRTIGRKWVHYKGMTRNGLKSIFGCPHAGSVILALARLPHGTGKLICAK